MKKYSDRLSKAVEEAAKIKEAAIVKTAKVNAMTDLIAGIGVDLKKIGELWEGILDRMDEHKFSFDGADGIFFHDREKLEREMAKVMKELESRIGEDCKRYRENIEAGKGSLEDKFAQYYSLGEPLRKTQDQVSTFLT